MSLRPNSAPADPQHLLEAIRSLPPEPVYATLIAVEICALGDRRHADIGQLRKRHEMYVRLRKACMLMRLLWPDCEYEDAGDGVLIVAPPDIQVDELLDPLTRNLPAILGRCDQRVGRMRVAVHAGFVHREPYGFAGPDLAHLFRLLAAATLRNALENTDADIGMIVSDRLYDGADRILHIDPAAYRRIRITCTEARAHTWVWLPR
jgi:hypothetical protein